MSGEVRVTKRCIVCEQPVRSTLASTAPKCHACRREYGADRLTRKCAQCSRAIPGYRYLCRICRGE